MTSINGIDKIEETGIWWDPPWWRNEQNNYNLKISPVQIEAAMETLISIFNADWFKKNYKQKTDHEFALVLMMGGSLTLPFIVQLGADLHEIFKHKHLVGDLKKRLKNKDQYRGARFEVNLLAHFLRCNFEIKRDVQKNKGNKNSDFQVKDGEDIIYFELKTIKQSKVNSNKFQFFIKSITELTSQVNNLSYFDFLPEFKKNHWIKKIMIT